jgi:hypothetical protein
MKRWINDSVDNLMLYENKLASDALNPIKMPIELNAYIYNQHDIVFSLSNSFQTDSRLIRPKTQFLFEI